MKGYAGHPGEGVSGRRDYNNLLFAEDFDARIGSPGRVRAKNDVGLPSFEQVQHGVVAGEFGQFEVDAGSPRSPVAQHG
nr:hypothetical protein [Mycobacterium montefiorense]